MSPGNGFYVCSFFFPLSWWSTIQSKIIEASRHICHTFPVGPQLFVPLSCLPPHDSIVLLLFVHSCLSLFHSARISLKFFPCMVPHFQSSLKHDLVFHGGTTVKCKLAEHVAIRTLFLPWYLLLGHLFQTKAFMDSFKFFVLPGKHLARRAGSFSLS